MVKLKKSQLKELIRQSIKEIDFKDKSSFDAYKKKHKMRGSTKVNVAGKDTTVDKASGKSGGEIDWDKKIGKDTVGDILDNPKHPNYDKAEKYASQFNPDDEKLVTGKGPQVKGGPKPGGNWDTDQIMNAKIGKEKISDLLGDEEHPDYGVALKYVMGFNPDDEKLVTGPGKKAKKKAKDIDKQSMKAADDANAKMDAAEKAKEKEDNKSEAEKVHDRVGEFMYDNEDIPDEYTDALDDLRDKLQNAGTDKEVAKLNKQAREMMDDIEQRGMDGEFDESIKESKKRRFTVKEVRMWMKKLEENRYKKVYNADARRVSWMANNEGVELSEMPKSMSKKWTKAQYGRERYLATEFVKSKSEQMMEGKLRGLIRKVIKEQLNEGKFAELYMKNDMKTKIKVSKIIKQMRLKIDKDYDVKALDSKGKVQKFFILPKHRDKFLELLMINKIKVRG